MDAALRVMATRLEGGTEVSDPAANPLGGIRITDVLDDVNHHLRAADPQAVLMTTGAAYNIWPTQEEFQVSVLDRIFLDAAKIGDESVRDVLEQAIAEGVEWREVVARCFGADFDLSYDEASVFLMLGVIAMGPRQRLVELSAEPNEVYLAYVSELLQRILEYAGRTLIEGRTLVDLVWAVEAVESGLLLRRRTHPDVPGRRDGTGRTALESALIAVVEAYTQPR